MAKDGTMRGGARVGAGKKPKALHQKINEGSVDGAFVLPQPVELDGADVPPVKEYLKAAQKNGKELLAEEVFNETYLWLKKFGCAELVNTQLINQYAMAVARQIQCEEALSEYGFLAKHPTTGNAISSPYVSMLIQFTKQANQAWMQIYQIVKENCAVDFGASPHDDMMERLLASRRKS